MRLLNYARHDGAESIQNYIALNRLMLDNNPADLAKSLQWHISGLFYNLWVSEFEFEDVSVNDSLEEYYPADAHYDLWKDNINKIFDLALDDENELDTEALKPTVLKLNEIIQAD